MIGGSIWCFLRRQHKDRRLRKADDTQHMPITQELAALPRSQLRICSTCGRVRAVKARKAKVAA